MFTQARRSRGQPQFLDTVHASFHAMWGLLPTGTPEYKIDIGLTRDLEFDVCCQYLYMDIDEAQSEKRGRDENQDFEGSSEKEVTELDCNGQHSVEAHKLMYSGIHRRIDNSQRTRLCYRPRDVPLSPILSFPCAA
ncbi:hypothetical protein PQX77_019018 [Marasmius sp. AFHP31]|nr:hypothetical protein PQX77_019018 [Marasmius sp. AFHP31]